MGTPPTLALVVILVVLLNVLLTPKHTFVGVNLAVKLLWQFTGVLANRLAETTRNLGIAREELVGEDITCEIFGEDDDENVTAELP